jgi:hypothetical protein
MIAPLIRVPKFKSLLFCIIENLITTLPSEFLSAHFPFNFFYVKKKVQKLLVGNARQPYKRVES